MPDRVAPGDPLQISAESFNTMLDAAEDFKRRKAGRAPTGEIAGTPLGGIWTKNATGADLGRYTIVGLSAPLITPTDNPREFENVLTANAVTPTDTHAGKFGVFLEPVPIGKLGRLAVDGVVQTKVRLVDTADTFAEVDPGVTANLVSGTSGSASILWAETVSAGSVAWCYVRIGLAVSQPFIWVKITSATLISPNRWRYTGIRQTPLATGSFQDYPGAPTITPIYNTAETFNAAAGIQGNGVLISDLRPNLVISEVRGNPVLPVRREVIGGTVVYFTWPMNGIKGTCA